MQKFLLVALLAACSAAGAGTVYLDQPQPFEVPSGVPCLVVVTPNLVFNAHLLTRVEYLKVDDKMLTEFASHNSVRRAEGNQVALYVKAIADCKARAFTGGAATPARSKE